MDSRRPPRFACDAMLGGLARWLRAAGYDASWHDGIDDGELVRLGQAQGRTVLSSDGDVFAFALVRDGVVPALFVREPRCMACGGELAELPKEEAAGRVPPRSLAAHDCFWVCSACGQVFWHGTHWRKIEERLGRAGSRPDGGNPS